MIEHDSMQDLLASHDPWIPDAGDRAQAEQWAYVAVCPYCGNERDTDVVNAAGECPTVPCCGETHCLDRNHPENKHED